MWQELRYLALRPEERLPSPRTPGRDRAAIQWHETRRRSRPRKPPVPCSYRINRYKPIDPDCSFVLPEARAPGLFAVGLIDVGGG